MRPELRPKVFDNVHEIVKEGKQDDFVVWKIFLYSDEKQRFLVDGALKISEPSYGQFGRTLPLMANDCIVWITEFDAENLIYRNTPEFEILAIEATNEKNEKILAYKSHPVTYRFLETKGYCLEIEKVKIEESDTIKIKLKKR